MKPICLSCMTENGGGAFCTNCGAKTGTLNQAPHLLKAGSFLKGIYLIGRALGQGGFGITYAGLDCRTAQKVAIKEFYPNGFVKRNDDGTGVSPTSQENSGFFMTSKSRFIDEASRLARFSGKPGIVEICGFFEENGTAYIIMEFIEGPTLKHVLTQMGGTMPEQHVLQLMCPLIYSLAEIHKTGIIHRDIAPDNIMLRYPCGSVKLLDFGAAREIDASFQNTVAVAKHGYAPEEQYESNRARNGPWTDVYALCATIFHAIEGAPAPESHSRIRQETFMGFTKPVSATTKVAIEKGLALFPQNRWQSMYELSAALYPPPVSRA